MPEAAHSATTARGTVSVAAPRPARANPPHLIRTFSARSRSCQSNVASDKVHADKMGGEPGRRAGHRFQGQVGGEVVGSIGGARAQPRQLQEGGQAVA